MTEYMELKAMGNGKTGDEVEAPKPVPTPPNEEDPYTLTAYGDISLSDIDFVPGPPSEISPSQVTKKKKKESWQFPRNDPEKMTRFPSITNRVRPPSFSKARAAKEEELTFDKLVMDLRRDAEKSLSKGRALFAGKSTSEEVQIHSPQPKRPIDLKGLGGEMDATKTDGKVPNKPLRGNGKLPKRPPIPRWDCTGQEGGPFKLGMSSWATLT